MDTDFVVYNYFLHNLLQSSSEHVERGMMQNAVESMLSIPNSFIVSPY